MKKHYLVLAAISTLFAENISQPQIQEPKEEKAEVQQESYPYIGIGIGFTTLLDSRISAAGLKSTFMTTELYLGYEFSIFKNLQNKIYLSLGLTPLTNWGGDLLTSLDMHSSGVSLDTLFNWDNSIQIFENPNYRLNLVIGAGLGGRFVKQTLSNGLEITETIGNSFITRFNIGISNTIQKHHMIDIIVKPTLLEVLPFSHCQASNCTGYFNDLTMTFSYNYKF